MWAVMLDVELASKTQRPVCHGKRNWSLKLAILVWRASDGHATPFSSIFLNSRIKSTKRLLFRDTSHTLREINVLHTCYTCAFGYMRLLNCPRMDVHTCRKLFLDAKVRITNPIQSTGNRNKGHVPSTAWYNLWSVTCFSLRWNLKEMRFSWYPIRKACDNIFVSTNTCYLNIVNFSLQGSVSQTNFMVHIFYETASGMLIDVKLELNFLWPQIFHSKFWNEKSQQKQTNIEVQNLTSIHISSWK